MAMEAHKLRFVRCPGCLQLLVEYPSIPVYQCGGCGTVLRAKNRVVPVLNTNSESGEQNKLSNSSTGDLQHDKLICPDVHKITPSSNAQPSEAEEKISFVSEDVSPCENVNEERTMFVGMSIDSADLVNMDKCSLVDGSVSHPDDTIVDIHDEGTGADSGIDLIREVENGCIDENVNSEKGSIMNDGSTSNEFATIRSMANEELGAGSNNNSTGEVENLAEEKYSPSNKNVNCLEIVEGCKPDEETKAKTNNVSTHREERSQPYENFCVESHEDLIEELVRSLSLSDEEEDFVDIADSMELNDVSPYQMGSCRFSSGNKMNDAPRTDPHGQLIEELVMSFSDAEEPPDQHVVVAHNGIAETVHVDQNGKNLHIPDAIGANPYEECVSPLDVGHLKSGKSFQQNELVAVSTEEKEEVHLEQDKTANHAGLEADNGIAAVLSNLSNERFCSTSPASFDYKKEEKSYRFRARELCQGLSLDYEDFRSIQNFIESQMDGTSSCLSSGSSSHGDPVHKTPNKFKKIDQLGRLKKMDELRDQLSRLSSQKGLEKRYQRKCLEHLQQQNSYRHIEQHPQGIDADSILSSGTIDPYYDHGKPPRYPPPVPFSPPHSYTHCHFGQRQLHVPSNCSAWEFNSYYQSSYSGSTILEHESLSSSYKEQKRAVRKHILRSLLGASPFTICNGCFNLVLMPSDMYVSKSKIAKIQCGQCSKVLVLSFPATHGGDANIYQELTKKPKKPGQNKVANEDAASYSAVCPGGDPVGSNEECSTSFSRNLSSRARPAGGASGSGKNVSDSALHRLMGYDSASQLLRHSRVFDDGYDSFESMVPVSNRVSRRKNL